jgi:hypothetical protein
VSHIEHRVLDIAEDPITFFCVLLQKQNGFIADDDHKAVQFRALAPTRRREPAPEAQGFQLDIPNQ